MRFSLLESLTIPEGAVTRIFDEDGRILWETTAIPGDIGSNYPNLPSGGNAWYKGNTNKVLITKIMIYDNYTATGTEAETWAISDNITGYRKGMTVIIAGDGSGKINANPDFSQFFYGFSAVTSITGLEYINTYHVTNMSYLFGGCARLSSVDVSSFDTRNVVNMAGMFSSCQALTALDVTNFNTTKVTNMKQMFQYCSTLKKLDLTSFYTGNVTTTNSMFSNCSTLTSITGTYGKWIIEDNCDTAFMFSNCGTDYVKLIGEPDGAAPMLLGGNTWYKGTTDKSIITTIQMLDTFTPVSSQVEESWNADINDNGEITCYIIGTSLTIAGNGSGKIYANESTQSMFSMFEGVKTIDISLLDTRYTTNMYFMFGWCRELRSLTFGRYFDTSQVTNMSNMFLNSFSANVSTTLDLTGWDTSNVTDMSYMFATSNSLLDLNCASILNTSNVTDMTGMFSGKMEGSLDLSGWDTSKVTNMSQMFEMCYYLTSINVSGFDTSNVTDMSRMFAYCWNITELDLTNFDTSNVTDMSSMFYYDDYLKTIEVSKSKWVTRNDCNTSNMFLDCGTSTFTYI